MTYARKEQLSDEVTLYQGDCRDILPTLGKVDAVVTDPPYGIGETGNNSRQKPGVSRLGTKTRVVHYEKLSWDNSAPLKETIEMVRSAGQWAIIFGGNYFELGPTPCWLVWDKQNGDSDFADCELAWTNLRKAVRRIYWRWNGMIRKGDDERQHPTQKPEGVMRWCIEHLPPNARTILDPFMGSGTTGVACVQLGRKFIGIELDPRYFDIACKRISDELKRPRLDLGEPIQQPKQETLF